jgi:hypothetical protein
LIEILSKQSLQLLYQISKELIGALIRKIVARPKQIIHLDYDFTSGINPSRLYPILENLEIRNDRTNYIIRNILDICGKILQS